jgi:hypothetical protein
MADDVPMDGDGQTAHEPPDDDVGRLWALLGTWAADLSAGDAAAARSRQRWLSAGAGESATFTGSLVDAAETGGAATLRTSGPALTGRLAGVGRDFCVLEATHGAAIVVALGAVQAVEVVDRPGRDAGTGDRTAPLDMDLRTVVDLLAADRQRVRIHLVGGTVTGALRSVGDDVIVLVAGDASRRRILVPVAALVAVEPT